MGKVFLHLTYFLRAESSLNKKCSEINWTNKQCQFYYEQCVDKRRWNRFCFMKTYLPPLREFYNWHMASCGILSRFKFGFELVFIVFMLCLHVTPSLPMFHWFNPCHLHVVLFITAIMSSFVPAIVSLICSLCI